MEFGFSKALVTAALRIADAGIIVGFFFGRPGIGQTIIFLLCRLFYLLLRRLLLLFHRLISAVADWMSVILPHNHDVALVRI